MVYLFEDSPKSFLSLLYKLGFESSIADRMVFNSSCGEISKISKYYIEHTSSMVYAFIDVIPDNPRTVFEFKRVWKLYCKHPDRLRIIPIVCSEYYFLKSIQGTNLVINTELLNFCLYSKCHLLDTKWVSSKSGDTNFEQYCKHVVKTALVDCAGKKHSSRKNAYLLEDCVCKNPFDINICTPLMVKDKAIRYISAYPLIPKGSLVQGNADMTDKIYLDYLVKFVQLHNSRVHNYIDNFPNMLDTLSNCIIDTDYRGIPVND